LKYFFNVQVPGASIFLFFELSMGFLFLKFKNVKYQAPPFKIPIKNSPSFAAKPICLQKVIPKNQDSAILAVSNLH
jgi:hypothetical protein